VLFYVDNCLLLFYCDYKERAKKIWGKATRKYKLQEQGNVKWFLGMRVIWDRKKQIITLVYNTYINKITAKFGLYNRLFPPTLLPSKELVKYTSKATKAQIKAF
jgi:hypothetical protein